MSKVTFVFDYPDGKEPAISAGMTYLGGEIVSASFSDLSEENMRLEEQVSELQQELAEGDSFDKRSLMSSHPLAFLMPEDY